MKFRAIDIRKQYNESGKAEIVLSTDTRRLDISKLKEVVSNGKELSVEIKQYRQKRSLDANSYAWVLMAKIADVLRTDKESVYIEMLKRYGQRESELVSVIAEAADMIYRATNNHCMEVGESELNGKLFKHMAILIGSSQYNTKQMSILIDGIVSEAKELNIETMTPAELAGLKERWGKG
jgi:hypothetical protein